MMSKVYECFLVCLLLLLPPPPPPPPNQLLFLLHGILSLPCSCLSPILRFSYLLPPLTPLSLTLSLLTLPSLISHSLIPYLPYPYLLTHFTIPYLPYSSLTPFLRPSLLFLQFNSSLPLPPILFSILPPPPIPFILPSLRPPISYLPSLPPTFSPSSLPPPYSLPLSGRRRKGKEKEWKTDKRGPQGEMAMENTEGKKYDDEGK